ncbi:MtrAB system histidine kinase MtrB [Phycicoccus sonneratiae]|uniref:Sensor histidine kinase MtrB n=1 Tax=Phycicoccus sonneratiae TaxID=2807628 RepID=A0ABS2CM15_9MICO|nr:MtrAB system histidine kinase MtrB [Phycicoccus sonneraticus]MBM6400921.1 HAMP domain-containing histidine kinase [Phycicoccus sonneraticus]
MAGSAGVGVQRVAAPGRGARARASLATFFPTVRAGFAGVRRRWRQSLRLRVVATTMLLGLVVVTVLGSVLHAQIAGGLERSRMQSSQYEALALTAQAQKQWDASTSTSVAELNRAANDIMTKFLSAPGPDPSRYVVMDRSPANDTDVTLVQLASSRAVDIDVVTEELREAVAATPGRQQTQVTEVRIGTREVPSVIVGSVVQAGDAGPYDLYFIFPMEQEVATMDLIGNAFLVAGVILTLLVGAVAWVVTRQVVTPVRRAGEVAQRLSAGRLNERMPARGEDDLALLATSFNNMADSLQSQIRQLEGLSAVQQRFVSDVSHELRTPLTTIRMAVDVIHDSRQAFEPSVSRSAELLAGELDRFEDLLADLLEISRFDAGAAALDLEPVDLCGTVAKVVEAARPLADRRGSVVRVHAAGGPAEAEVDERRVERILRNLVVNAVEHGEGRPVDVHVASGSDAVAVVVEDHGVGLRPGEAANVFTRFWRADPARARTTGGTGLGLSISLEDARLHNGWLQAWGEPGEGSRFRLTLPRHAGASLHASPLPLSPADES